MSSLGDLWEKHGQAIWLDFIQRSHLETGGLNRLMSEDRIRGVTSNPSIFCQAIAGSDEYDASVDEILAGQPGLSTVELYEALAMDDIRRAADILRPVHVDSQGADGHVSLEVSPHLAHDTAGTIEEARRLWKSVDRANVMIKVPATPEGIPAIETLIAEGINVNATLIFSLQHYDAVANAYINGIRRCEDPTAVASVASFFVSRVDTAVDARLEELGTAAALELRGLAAVANARLAYLRFQELFHGPEFAPLKERGCKVQRALWASTGTKNPAYSDVLYVEELIGNETVNTLPLKTIDAFRDHGTPRTSLGEELDQAKALPARLKRLGIDIDDVTDRLQTDGVASFAKAFDKLLGALETKRGSR